MSKIRGWSEVLNAGMGSSWLQPPHNLDDAFLIGVQHACFCAGGSGTMTTLPRRESSGGGDKGMAG